LPWAARSLAYGLSLPHAGGGPADYRTQYSNTHDFFLEIFSIAAWVIWKQRNDKIFRAQCPSITSWKEKKSILVNQQLYRLTQYSNTHDFFLEIFSIAALETKK
jgi:hypothetical protein